MIALYIFVLALSQSSASETGKVGQVTKNTTPCGPMLETILRLERAVNNMTWELELTKTAMKNKMEATNKELKATKTDLETTKTNLVSTEEKLAEALYQIKEIANVTVKLGVKKDISFQVKQKKHPYIPGLNEPLKFDEVTMNKGDCYNPTSGIFTVPRTGTYFCWLNILSAGEKFFYVRLLKEGQEIVRSHTGINHRPGSCTITYLMDCKEGDHVWFDVAGSALGMDGDNYSSYGCYLRDV